MTAEQLEARNTAGVRIRTAVDSSAKVESLAEVLLGCVKGGASVSFMHPLPREKAMAFWSGILASAARGERLVLVAEDAASGDTVGTVQILTALPENQPHRCDVAIFCREPSAGPEHLDGFSQ